MEEPRTYEFAYHLTTQMDEGKPLTIHAEIEALIGKHGGVIVSSQQPAPKRLSYEILHQRQTYFGWVQFSADSGELLLELDEWARLHTEVLRHITLKLEPESDKRAAKQAAHLERKAAKQAREGVVAKKPTTTEKKAVDSGKLEKDIEDVLGNL